MHSFVVNEAPSIKEVICEVVWANKDNKLEIVIGYGGDNKNNYGNDDIDDDFVRNSNQFTNLTFVLLFLDSIGQDQTSRDLQS